ncbi:hypothetical protein HDU85_004641 [Gaertneriomyces sp. JEL0708]|nr:hypothetical protein HDU85_004641 [Gaertneriomyces sp. JEL0708]
MSSYDFAGGSLKLKGVMDNPIKKKKKKKSKQEKEKLAKVVANEVGASSSTGNDKDKEDGKKLEYVYRQKTEAELKFEEVQRKRQAERIKKTAAKSHKERVAEYNKYLESLSEHYDIPKVGPG